MSHHFLNLKHATTLRTTGFRLAEEAVMTAASREAMVVIHGSAGTGKTFAVEAALSSVEAVDTNWLLFPSRATQKRVVGQILKDLTGTTPKGDRYDLIDDAIRILADRRRLLVIDEAQELSWDGLELLRHLHDDRRTHFGLVLIGADGCWDLIAKYPPLESRMLRRVAFMSLGRKDIVQLIPRFHPIYEQTSRDVIAFIDDHFAHGKLRNWARFTDDAAAFCEAQGLAGVTQETATAVFMLQRGAASAASTSPRPARPERYRKHAA